MRINKNELNSLLNNAYWLGREDGRKEGKREAYLSICTPNEIRKAFGLLELSINGEFLKQKLNIKGENNNG